MSTLDVIFILTYPALVWIIFLGVINPLSHWNSYWCVLKATIKADWLPKRGKLRLFAYLLRDLMLSPVHCALWILDDVLFGKRLDRVRLKNPVFIVSQPRCGSTFLHRLLAEDEDTFFAVTYLEWHWPYICVWVLIDRLGIRKWINNWNYWSNRNSTASKMHPHLYGDYEEYGIFLEEKFYHHYFVFRRFPFTSLLDKLVHFDTLNKEDQKHILDTFEHVVRKVAYYRGSNKIWLTKENECASFYRELFKIFPTSTFLFLVRDHEDMLASYVTLSRESTLSKTGIDMTTCVEWHRANIEFRRQECTEFVAFYNEVKDNGYAVLLNYNNFVSNVFKSTLQVYHYLQIDISKRRASSLVNLTTRQKTRTRDYSISKLTSEDTKGFDKFADLVRISNKC